MSNFIEFIGSLLGRPEIIIGVIVLIGLLAQKKAASEVIRGTLKAILGFIIIQQGAGILVGALANFGPLVQEVLGM